MNKKKIISPAYDCSVLFIGPSFDRGLLLLFHYFYVVQDHHAGLYWKLSRHLVIFINHSWLFGTLRDKLHI